MQPSPRFRSPTQVSLTHYVCVGTNKRVRKERNRRDDGFFGVSVRSVLPLTMVAPLHCQ